MASIISELKRRNIFKVGVAYAIVAWLLIQIIVAVKAPLHLPAWMDTFIIILLIIGFPLALIFAWVSDMGQGVSPTEGTIQAASGNSQALGQRLNIIIVSLLVLAVGFLILDQYVLEDSTLEDNTTSGAISPLVPNATSNRVQRTSILLEEEHKLALDELAPLGVGRRSLALSPDGESLSYTVNENGISRLYLRRLDEYQARPLAGTEGAFGPFFSPDGQWIGFHTHSEIKKVSIQGGTPRTLTEAGNVVGASWGPEDMIVFAEAEGRQVSMIPADGGEKNILLDNLGFLSFPKHLPENNGILLSWSEKNQIVIFKPDTGELIPVIEGAHRGIYVATGHIIYTSSNSDIYAVPFDLSNSSLKGPAVPVLNGVRIDREIPQLAVSANGILAYIPGPDMRLSMPVWVDRQGDEQEIPLPMQNYGRFQLSPDDSKLAFLLYGVNYDIWLYDFARETPPKRLTIGGNKEGGPIWSPDGEHIVYGINDDLRKVSEGIFQQNINGGEPKNIIPANNRTNNTPESYLASNHFSFTADSPVTGPDVWITQLGGDTDPEAFVQTTAFEWGGTFSPDGRYVAYTSDESGEYQVYVKEYPATESRWLISTGYGEEPVWSDSGDEIIYRSGQRWFSVSVQTAPVFEARVPQLLFEGPYVNVPHISYGVSSDAQRFLVLKKQEQVVRDRIHLVINWFDELTSLAPPDTNN